MALIPACQSEAQKECATLVAGLEARLNATNPKEEKSVLETMDRLKEGLSVCDRAGDRAAVDDIDQAMRNYAEHLTQLKKAQSAVQMAAPRVVTDEQLLETGDPNCPRGQSWIHPKFKKEILCTGPSLVEMDPGQAMAHFARMGFAAQRNENALDFRSGERIYRYYFEKLDAKAPAKCLQIGLAPQETLAQGVAMATGVKVSNIQPGKPVTSGERQLALMSNDDQRTVALGDCAGVAPLARTIPPQEPKKESGSK